MSSNVGRKSFFVGKDHIDKTLVNEFIPPPGWPIKKEFKNGVTELTGNYLEWTIEERKYFEVIPEERLAYADFAWKFIKS